MTTQPHRFMTTQPHRFVSFSTPRQQRGLTLVEAAMALAVTSVLVGSGVPALREVRATQVVNGAAAQLRTDLQFARSSAVASGQNLRLHLANDARGSCYVIHTGAPNDCQCTAAGTTTCAAPARALRAVHLAATQPVTMAANVHNMSFSGEQGTVTPTGTINVSHAASREQLRLVVNVMGRVRTCQPGARSGGMHPAC